MKGVTKWEDVSFVIASSYRTKILEWLKTPKEPSILSKETGINKTHISRGLKELEEKKIVKCLSPNAKKGKLYVISDYGKRVLEEALKIRREK